MKYIATYFNYGKQEELCQDIEADSKEQAERIFIQKYPLRRLKSISEEKQIRDLAKSMFDYLIDE